MSYLKYLTLCLLLVVAVGCGGTAPESAEQQPPAVEDQSDTQTLSEQAPAAAENESRAAGTSEPAPAGRSSRQDRVTSPSNPPLTPREPARSPARQVLEEPATPKAPEPRYVTIPAGTKLHVRLQEPLDTSVNKSGDSFQAILDEALDVDGNKVAPRGSIVEGRLSDVERAGRVEGRSKMSLRIVSLFINDQAYTVDSQVLAFEAESTVKKDATKVGLGAGIGAVIGAIAGGGKGAAIGAAVGGGAGGATVIATRGKDLKFEPEQQFSFELLKDLQVKIQ